jgi:hypothetical protein
MKKLETVVMLIVIIVIIGSGGCNKHEKSEFNSGFDKSELLELITVAEHMYDSVDISGFKTPLPTEYIRVYRSPVSVLKNRFDIWKSEKSKVVIAIRGTILDKKGISFAEDFHAYMVPAIGKTKISNEITFQYKLAELSGAGVHLGLLLGLYTLHEDMIEQINLRYTEGVRNYYIIGHSQGSGVAYLATAYLWYLQKDGKLPSDIQFKTYCIAAPKAGNTPFAYDYENLTKGGWAFSIQNTADWIPYCPITFETAGDLPPISGFTKVREVLTEIHYPPGPNFNDAYAKYGKLQNEVLDGMQQVIKEIIYPKISALFPEYVEPELIKSLDFERIGVTIPLIADKDYYKKFPDSKAHFNVWENHSPYPYYYLAGKMK